MINEPQKELDALVAARNLGDPTKLLPDLTQIDCEGLAAELTTRRRTRDLFANLIPRVEEDFAKLSTDIAATVAARDRRTIERDAAARLVKTNQKALDDCEHKGGEINGECPRQELFLLQSENDLVAAEEALSAATASLQALQVKGSEIGKELLSLKADRVALEAEISTITAAMEQAHCPVPV